MMSSGIHEEIKLHRTADDDLIVGINVGHVAQTPDNAEQLMQIMQEALDKYPKIIAAIKNRIQNRENISISDTYNAVRLDELKSLSNEVLD